MADNGNAAPIVKKRGRPAGQNKNKEKEVVKDVEKHKDRTPTPQPKGDMQPEPATTPQMPRKKPRNATTEMSPSRAGKVEEHLAPAPLPQKEQPKPKRGRGRPKKYN